MIRAAGLFLLLKHDYFRFCVRRYQNFLHRYSQQSAQSIQVVNGRQALSSLPLVDGLGFLKAEVGLQIPNSHAALFAQTHDVLAGFDHVDNRKRLLIQGFRLLLQVVQGYYMLPNTFWQAVLVRRSE